MKEKVTKNRMIHYDLLRIFAAFSVVMLHGAAQFWYTLDVNSTEWVIANSYDALFRFGVPVFVMISGALFLDRGYQLDVKRLYTHNILRLVVLYVVWSCLYGLYDCVALGVNDLDIKYTLREMLYGRYHLWFIPMITGIYVLLPVLKSWLEHAEQKNMEYFLMIFFVLQIGGETLRALTVTDELHVLLDLTKVEMACGYIGYFVWGYYLAHIGVAEKVRKLFYALALPASLCNVLLGNYLAAKAGRAEGAIYDSFGIFTFIVSTALFLFAAHSASRFPFGERSSRLIGEISAATFGIYVMHVGLMEISKSYGIHSMLLPNIVGIPIYVIACFAVCALLAAVLRRIPIIGKYIC